MLDTSPMDAASSPGGDPPRILQRIRRRLARELKGRSPSEAAGDLYRLYADHGLRGIAQRMGLPRGRAHRTAPSPDPHHLLATHGWGCAHAELFDLTPAILAANRAVVDRFAERPASVETATWFMPYFEHALYGGVHTILRLMSWMTEQHGVRHRLVLFDRMEARDEDVRSAVTSAFANLRDIDIVMPVDGVLPYDELPFTDIAICSLWSTAYVMARFNRTNAKFYMVADYEPLFYEAGTVYALSEATYRLGYGGIVNTPALGDLYRDYGNPTVAFVPAVDGLGRDIAKPSDRPGAPVQIVFYGRPSTPRNAFELIASACRQIKDRYGDAVRIISAGEEWDPADFGLSDVIENRGLLHSFDAVRQLYADSDIGISFMLSKHPSYQPLEYLASGVVPVCNVNSSTEWLLHHGENCLITEPFPSNVAAAVARLVDDVDLRIKLAATGYDLVTATDWQEQFTRVWAFVTNQ